MLKLTGTFIDEISHDIPSQNFSADDWAKEFATMKAVGIDTVIMIRCGYQKWLTYPSKFLVEQRDAFTPPVDLVDMFLELAERNGIDFYFGLYDSGEYWLAGEYQKEVDLNRRVVDEVWSTYGDRAAFKGWYLSQEVGRKEHSIIELYRQIAGHCKDVSGDLDTLISPYICGVYRPHIPAKSLEMQKGLLPDEHREHWDEILSGIGDMVDIVAFQDGGAGWDHLDEYLAINKELADKHGLRCWSNTESFDRDVWIQFPPIKFEKLMRKLNAAETVGVEKAITFEFSTFMSPNSCWPSGRNLFKRYCEQAGIDYRETCE